MKKVSLLLLICLGIACTVKQKKESIVNNIDIPKLTLEEANRLIQLPLHCIDVEYPNKLNQVIGDDIDLQSPKELHPAFYGCFDWHSSVHGHWSLVSLIKQFPNAKSVKEAREKLENSITKENIEIEVSYFHGKHNKSYERTYGWAWLLKLAEELNTWDDPLARKLEKNLQPLTDLIVQKYIEFLPKLTYPIRVGEHTNTAFGLTFAWDYANTVQHEKLKSLIEKRAKDFYFKDENCPITWEPSGFDFLSPCLEEATLMLKVLPKEEYLTWLDQFLPGFRTQPSQYISPVEVVDKTDGKMAHLDGLNFSRTWCLYQIGKALDNNKMIALANTHFNDSYSKMDTGEYAGAHWLASFALHALKAGK